MPVFEGIVYFLFLLLFLYQKEQLPLQYPALSWFHSLSLNGHMNIALGFGSIKLCLLPTHVHMHYLVKTQYVAVHVTS